MELPSASVTATINLPVPAGTIIHYIGLASNLAGLHTLGWLVCDGSSLTQAAYPTLFAAIGTTFGGDAANFSLPNLLGMFLRGVDPSGTEDPDYKTRTSPIINNGTQVGPVVGSRQGEQLKSHYHNWSRNFGQISASGSSLNIQLCNDGDKSPNQGTQRTTDTDGGGNETRPKNAYVYYLIFAGLSQS
jgi:hypothetical protein